MIIVALAITLVRKSHDLLSAPRAPAKAYHRLNNNILVDAAHRSFHNDRLQRTQVHCSGAWVSVTVPSIDEKLHKIFEGAASSGAGSTCA